MAEFIDCRMLDNDSNPVICYRSSLMVAEETLYDGVPVSSGYNAAGYPLNVLTNCPSRLNPRDYSEPFCFNFEIDGQTVCRNMKLISFDKKEENGSLHIEVKYSSGIRDITITEHTILDGTSMFTRYFELTNNSEENMSVNRMVLHGGGIETLNFNEYNFPGNNIPENLYEYGCFANDIACKEGEMEFRTLNPGFTGIASRFGEGRHRHPALFIRNNYNGRIYYIQVGWSGGVKFDIHYNRKSGESVTKLSYNAEIDCYKPILVIRPEETVRTPELHFCAVQGDLDTAINEGIRHIRKSVLNLPEADGSALMVGSGMGPEHDMSVDTSKAFAKQLHDMGAEVFIVDAGWYCPPDRETEWYDLNCDYTPDKDRYPNNGFNELIDYIHSLGMKFGLWIEPERMGRRSKIAALHPEWISKDLYGEERTGFIDLSIPEAAGWFEEEVDRIITEYRLDLLRIDYNIGGNEPYSFRDNGTGIEENISYRLYMNVYNVYNRLKKKHPDVIFENCASGGGRTDLGMMKNFCHTWVSDNQIMPRSTEITNGMTMVLPPERVDRLFAGMGCHTFGDIKSHLRNTMLGHISLNVITPAALSPNEEVMDFIRHSISIYKNDIRKIIPGSSIYHHTPDRKSSSEKGCRITELSSEDRTESVITVFTEPMNNTGSVTVYPRGLLSERLYTVYYDNTQSLAEVSGYELINNGITVKLSGALSSELLIIKQKH